jgi:hypothetical protein
MFFFSQKTILRVFIIIYFLSGSYRNHVQQPILKEKIICIAKYHLFTKKILKYNNLIDSEPFFDYCLLIPYIGI